MQEFKDRVAVITGAASGIGLSLAERCINEGMKVVLADIEESVLISIEREMTSQGARVLAIPTDVSQPGDVEALARYTIDNWGAVHLLFNNAGVITIGSAWESTINDWKWVIGVNLWGVIHGIHTFVPIMLEQDTDCHIINTASIAGLVSPSPGTAIYHVTKHAVVALSEALYHGLLQSSSKIQVSVLCPGFVKTQLMEAGRNRAEELHNESSDGLGKPAAQADQVVAQSLARAISNGILPRQVADAVFDSIRENKFYILVNIGPWQHALRTRVEDILQERNPTIPRLDL
ncbi:MAG: SDR family NAD(P)-dependent oxidoreductase [Dehalococcoidales bacterium]|nr:MAG: SDR family NAD(P)-dependent oxidoreductase [Dehalococcoidales bacterium]